MNVLVREVVAIVDVQVRIYGSCGHIVDTAMLQHDTLKGGEWLGVGFFPQRALCAKCSER